VDSDLEGHPTPRNRWVKVATGSLGQGLSMAVGLAWAARHHRTASHTFALLGDGETMEGSVWEAAAVAAHLGLGHLTAVVDINRFGQTGATMLGHDSAAYRRRFEAFGWRVSEIDGHDIAAIASALAEARVDDGRPTAILALSEKGKGVPQLEGAEGRHGKPAESLHDALAELGQDALVKEPEGHLGEMPETVTSLPERPEVSLRAPTYKQASRFATREAFGDAMLELGRVCPTLVGLDGDVKNSTKLDAFFDEYPDRSIQCYIAEQNMVGMSVGLSAAGFLPCIATFAAFLTRAFDQLRMAAISRSRLIVAGSHCGVAIGRDGPSQMGLEDLAMMRALPGSLVMHPGDASSAWRCLELAANHGGISYLRLTRNKLPVIYAPDESFEPGGSKVHGASADDRVTLVGAGVTLHECLKARTRLREQGIAARVVDCFSIKPIDSGTLRKCAKETGGLVIAEDHYAEGGLGEAVAGVLAGMPCKCVHLAVREVSRSGRPEDLLERHGISSARIERAAMQLVS
jgi:transketolase